MPRVRGGRKGGSVSSGGSLQMTRGAEDRAHVDPILDYDHKWGLLLHLTNAAAVVTSDFPDANTVAGLFGTTAAVISPLGEPTAPIYSDHDHVLSDDMVLLSSSGTSKRQREVDDKSSVGEEGSHDTDRTTDEEQDMEQPVSPSPNRASCSSSSVTNDTSADDGDASDSSLPLLAKRPRTRSPDLNVPGGMSASSATPVSGLFFSPHTPTGPPPDDYGFSTAAADRAVFSPERSPSPSPLHESPTSTALDGWAVRRVSMGLSEHERSPSPSPLHESPASTVLDGRAVRRVSMGLSEHEMMDRYTPQWLIPACGQLFSIDDGGNAGLPEETDDASSFRGSSSSSGGKRRLSWDDEDSQHNSSEQDGTEAQVHVSKRTRL